MSLGYLLGSLLIQPVAHKVNRLTLLSLVAVFSCAVLLGCGRGRGKLTAADMRAFDGAAPGIKQSWAQAQAAAETNDYVQAILTLRLLLRQDLTQQQVDAVRNALISDDAKLMRAVDRGDPAAQKALETLRSPAAQVGH